MLTSFLVSSYDPAGLVGDPPPYDISICDIVLDSNNFLTFHVWFNRGLNQPSQDNPFLNFNVKIFSETGDAQEVTLLNQVSMEQVFESKFAMGVGLGSQEFDTERDHRFRFNVSAVHPGMGPIAFRELEGNNYDVEIRPGVLNNPLPTDA